MAETNAAALLARKKLPIASGGFRAQVKMKAGSFNDNVADVVEFDFEPPYVKHVIWRSAHICALEFGNALLVDVTYLNIDPNIRGVLKAHRRRGQEKGEAVISGVRLKPFGYVIKVERELIVLR